MAKVSMLGAHSKMTVEEALSYCQKEKLRDVLIIAYDKDGQLVIRSSALTKEQALFLSVKAQEHAMGWE